MHPLTSELPLLGLLRSRPVQVAAGLASATLGLIVAVAWLFRYEPLIRVHPLFPPMPYSAAIGLSACGVSLLAVAGQKRALARAGAVSMAVLGLVTLVHHGFGVDLNVDGRILGTLAAGLHGSMAPSTALSFVLLGVGLFAVCLNQQRGGFVCALCGTTVAAQSGVFFLADAFGSTAGYSIAGSDIAPHVAVGLTIAGIGTIAAAWHPTNEASTGVPAWLPLPIVLGMALISVSLWQQSASDRRATAEGVTLLRAERIGAEINRRALPLVSSLVKVANASNPRSPGDVRIEPRTAAMLDLERFPGLYGIAFVDPASRPVWAETRDGAPIPPRLLAFVSQHRGPVVLRAGGLRTVLVDHVEFGSGRDGFVIRVPVSGDDGAGFVLGLFRYDKFFHAAIGEDIGTDYDLRVFGDRGEIYRLGQTRRDENDITATAAVPFLGAEWHAQIWPRSTVNLSGSLANRTLIFGLLFSGLLGWTVQLGQRSVQRENQLTRANASLRSAIADREAAQAAYAASEVRFRQIIDAAADIIYRTDPLGRFIFVNPAAIRVLKWSRDDLIGRDYLSLIRPDYQQTVREFYQKQAQERTPNTYFDFPAVAADGQEVWIGQHVQLLTEGDRIVGFQAVARDISGRVRIQNELQQTRDAALETARMKSEFVARTSHEIRTPLNGILGFSNLLLGTSLDEEQRTYTDGLRLSADALLAVVNDILDFSKIDAGMLRLERVPFDLQATMDHVIVVMAEAARRKQIGLEMHVDSGLHRRLIGDPSRLRQVLTNLIANAIRFTDRGAVTVRVTTASQTEHEVVVAFAVHDTGIGIDADTQQRLFQPFVQGDSSSSRPGGTGLGLAICRQLVELMGGSIGLQSAPGSGATFSFSARFEKDSQTLAADADRAVDFTRLRMLIVADSPSFREELVNEVATWGATPTWIETGDDALRALRQAAAERAGYDVVILGLVHPEEDSLAVARRIKADPSLKSVKLVLVPLKGLLGDAGTAREIGVAGYLPRPVRGAELLRCVTSIVSDEANALETPPPLVTRHTLEERRAGPLGRVLVTDDTPVSRQVTKLQIEKLGYEVDTAADGADAVEAAARASYDLILMDCHMPVMDGYAATEEIRRREQGRRRTPIVAFTASVAPSGRERCFRAGMDDFIEKPIRSSELIDVLHRWVPQTSHGARVRGSTASQGEASGQVVDTTVLDALGNEIGSEALDDMIRIFLEHARTSIATIEQRAAEGPLDDLVSEGHRLKGSSQLLGFTTIGALCAALEVQARGLGAAERTDLVVRLKQAYADVHEWSRRRSGQAA
jgi:PAS domain S-box-containing protein